MQNLPRVVMALLVVCYVSESQIASALSRGYYTVPDSASSGSDETSTSSETGFDGQSREEGPSLNAAPSLTFGQHPAGETNGPEKAAHYFSTNIASILARSRPTQDKEMYSYILDDKSELEDEPKPGSPDQGSSSGTQSQYNDALFDALDRKYEVAKSSSNKAPRFLYPSRRFGKTQSRSEPELYRPVKRNLSCMRKCMAQGFIHPVQCHSLC